jgi:Holliday junction resolvasome RuvABC endonuclease subunit
MILGLDPSLRNFGWTLIRDDGSFLDKGTMKTEASEVFVTRYMYLRDGLKELIREIREKYPNDAMRVGIESPIFNDLYSEGMYGLFLYSNEALMLEKVDTVYLSPNQVKAHAAAFLNRPKGWKMGKGDMVDAAKQATEGQGAKRWNNHQADAFWVARAASRFWLLVEEKITVDDLSDLERRHFTSLERYVRGKKTGKVKRKGITHKEDDRFFRWSES